MRYNSIKNRFTITKEELDVGHPEISFSDKEDQHIIDINGFVKYINIVKDDDGFFNLNAHIPLYTPGNEGEINKIIDKYAHSFMKQLELDEVLVYLFIDAIID